jgi:hypothetical protein
MTDITVENDLQETVSYQKNVTGVAHTVFISPQGNARHGPRIKIAIVPPDSLDPRSETASVGFDGEICGRHHRTGAFAPGSTVHRTESPRIAGLLGIPDRYRRAAPPTAINRG